MKLTEIQQALIGLGVIVFAFLFMEFFFLKDDKLAIEKTGNDIAELEQKIRVANAIKQSADELQKEMSRLKEQLERLKKILPLDINKPKFMAEMKRFANENGLEILRVSNNQSVVNDVIVEHPFTYILKGNYHDFGNFYSQLTNYPYIINIKGLHLERDEKDPTYNVKGEFILSVFTYKEPTEEELKKQIQQKKKERQENRKKRRNT